MRLSWEEIHVEFIDPEIMARRVGTFTYCINSLPLKPGELALMRELLMHIQTDTLREWGAMNMTRRAEVEALFARCKELQNAAAA